MTTRIPLYMLRQLCTIELYAGDGALGATFADGKNFSCRLEPSIRLILDMQGNEVRTEARLYLEPEVEITPESRVTDESDVQYRVIQVNPQPGQSGAMHHIECWLGFVSQGQ